MTATARTAAAHKSSLYLDDALHAQVQALCATTGRSASELYRRAIRSYIDAQIESITPTEDHDLAAIRRAIAEFSAEICEVSCQVVCLTRDPESGARVELVAIRHQLTGKLAVATARLSGKSEYPIEQVMSRDDRLAFNLALQSVDRKRRGAA